MRTDPQNAPPLAELLDLREGLTVRVFRPADKELLMHYAARDDRCAIAYLSAICQTVIDITVRARPCLSCSGRIGKRGCQKAAFAVAWQCNSTYAKSGVFCARCAARMPDEELEQLAIASLAETLHHESAALRGSTYHAGAGHA